MTITVNTNVNYLIKRFPKTLLVFWNHGIITAGAPYLLNHTLEHVCESYGTDLDMIISDLQRVVTQKAG